MTYAKRLIEVDLPIKRISAHARREKSIRHGHISTLHIWWARRPLAACRAVICAALWPDPADPLCPQSFRDAGTRIITEFARRACGQGKILTQNLSASCSEESLQRWQVMGKPGKALDPKDESDWNILRFALLDFIADFANWDNSTVPEYLETARALTQAAHEALGGEPGTRPLVVDPFAGGGSIPLEALRVGADAFASDLNPVAVLLNKVVLEYIPQYGQKLADEVRKWGQWIKEQAEKELAAFYPKDPDGATPIAYLWARTITCEGPGCGAKVPLIASLWLGKKPHRSFALKLIADRKKKTLKYEVFSPKKTTDVEQGTVRRGSATCPLCGYTTPVQAVREQLRRRRGGSKDAELFCVVTTKPDRKGRFYRAPTKNDESVAARAAKELDNRLRGTFNGLTLVPDEPLPAQGTLGFRVQLYGMATWADLFSSRQLLTLLVIGDKVRQVPRSIGDRDLASAVQLLLALNLDKVVDYGSALATWSSPASQETVRQTFGRMALPMVWDFAEAYPFAESSGGWTHNLEYQIGPLESEARAMLTCGTALPADAAQHPLPENSAAAMVTDPPYYDAIPYADLSDFFLVWLKRSLIGSALAQDLPALAPKENECVVDMSKGHDRAYFEQTMTRALAESRRYVTASAIGVVVFAHKSTAGWEAQLISLLDAGWTITGSWPIETERQGRVRANASAALSSSVHLVCRPREAAPMGDWRDVLTELPKRIHDWMPRLASEGVVGADAIFACLGPALEIFSRYSRVEKADGTQVHLKEYLEYVWAAVAREALSMIFAGADATGFDPDARLTAMWFWTLSTGATTNGKPSEEDENERGADEESPDTSATGGGFVLEYDAARKIAQGLGAHLDQLNQVVEVKGDKARLLPVSERARLLFGKNEAKAPVKRGKKKSRQRSFLDEAGDDRGEESHWGELPAPQAGSTVLDRLHQSMILFGAGRGEALKRFLVEDGVGRDTRFWRLAQALSALYPSGTEEKRWVDGVLARKKGLGF